MVKTMISHVERQLLRYNRSVTIMTQCRIVDYVPNFHMIKNHLTGDEIDKLSSSFD